MIALSSAQIIGLLPPTALISAVEEAARLLLTGAGVVPDRLHLHWEDNTLLIMPALAGDMFSTKLVAIHPQNAQHGMPVTSGLMVINDAANGKPLALLNAGALTALRTGAVGALGLKYLTPEDTASVGIVGCGVQGAWQAIFACAIRPVKEVFCVGRSSASIAQFHEQVERHVPRVKITVCKDAVELLARTEVVITATTSLTPVLPDEPALLSGKQFVSIGSFRPHMQELPDSVYRLSGQLVVDSMAATHEVGDVINALRKGFLDDSKIFHIGVYVSGQRLRDASATTVFKSVGLAIYDLCVARALVHEAVRRGIGQEINL